METLRKIDELIVQNKILEKRNEELKNIIEVNLSQSQNFQELSLTSDADLSDTKNILVKFYQFNKIPIALYTPDGSLIFSIGGKNIPPLFHLNYEELFKNYISSGNLSQKIGNEYITQNGTLCFSLPIEANNKILAIIILHQYFNKDKYPTSEFFELRAKDNHLELKEIMSAQSGIPMYSNAELDSIYQYLLMLGEMISFITLKNCSNKLQLRKQMNNELVLSALLDKISEQELIIKSLLSNINNHLSDVRENTISKSDFQQQQKRLVDRIKHSEALLNSLLTSVPLGVGFIRSNVFTYTNDQMFSITGYTPKELIGRGPEIIFASYDDFTEIVEIKPESLLFKNKNSYETSILRKNGSLVDTIVFVSQIDSENPELGIAISILDISDIKKVQRELIAEKEKAEESDRLKTTFLDNMSHELRTPMNAIVGFTELLHSPYLTEKQKSEYAHIIQNNSRKLLRLIDDIIDISKLSSNQLRIHHKNFYLHQILSDIYEAFAENVTKKHGGAVELVLTEPIANKHIMLFNDDLRIKQILNNLLSNALKFTSKGIIEFGYSINNEEVTFFVKDTGSGIKKNQLNLIFERFRQCDDTLTRRHGGAGIGLSLVKGIVELMGGRIWVESAWRKGSAFYFALPLLTDIKKEVASPNIKKANDWSEKTILIAEDEELNYRYLQMLLQPTNAKIKWVDNGQKAIDYVNNFPDTNLILMDIRMPIVNGLEATKIIKSTNQRIPIIAQTAFAQSNEKEHYISEGCDEFIPKPIDSDHFMTVLEKFLNPV